jgi:hypothetical protein
MRPRCVVGATAAGNVPPIARLDDPPNDITVESTGALPVTLPYAVIRIQP